MKTSRFHQWLGRLARKFRRPVAPGEYLYGVGRDLLAFERADGVLVFFAEMLSGPGPERRVERSDRLVLLQAQAPIELPLYELSLSMRGDESQGFVVRWLDEDETSAAYRRLHELLEQKGCTCEEFRPRARGPTD
jgi:hypothetical protein